MMKRTTLTSIAATAALTVTFAAAGVLGTAPARAAPAAPGIAATADVASPSAHGLVQQVHYRGRSIQRYRSFRAPRPYGYRSRRIHNYCSLQRRVSWAYGRRHVSWVRVCWPSHRYWR